MPKHCLKCSCVIVQSHFSPVPHFLRTWITAGTLLLVFFCFPFMAKSCNQCGVRRRYTPSCESSWHVSWFKAFPRVLSVFYLFISSQWHEPDSVVFSFKISQVFTLNFLLNTTKNTPLHHIYLVWNLVVGLMPSVDRQQHNFQVGNMCQLLACGCSFSL